MFWVFFKTINQFQVEEHSRKDSLIDSLTSDKDQLGRDIDELESAGLDLKSRLENLVAEKVCLEQSAVADAAEKVAAILKSYCTWLKRQTVVFVMIFI